MRVPASIGRLCYVVITIERRGKQKLETSVVPPVDAR
jgi:hypothetical protein